MTFGEYLWWSGDVWRWSKVNHYYDCQTCSKPNMLYTNKILKYPKHSQQKVFKFMKISKNDLKSCWLFQMESWDELKMGRKGEGGCCRGVNENYHKIYPNIYYKIYLNRLTKFIKPNNKKESKVQKVIFCNLDTNRWGSLPPGWESF